MRRAISVCGLVAAMLLAPAVGHAGSIQAGDFVKFGDRPGSPGGEFLAMPTAGSAFDEFVTFCVQTLEYIDFTSTFKVLSISTVTHAAPGISLDEKTAWLYTQFRQGTFGDYGVSYDGSAAHANLLQKAIWYFMGGQSPYSASNPFIQAANTHAPGFGLGNVRILNLVKASTGAVAQDQLVLVPEPGVLVLLGAGIVAALARRQRLA